VYKTYRRFRVLDVASVTIGRFVGEIFEDVETICIIHTYTIIEDVDWQMMMMYILVRKCVTGKKYEDPWSKRVKTSW
jgi:hypothetical protein